MMSSVWLVRLFWEKNFQFPFCQEQQQKSCHQPQVVRWHGICCAKIVPSRMAQKLSSKNRASDAKQKSCHQNPCQTFGMKIALAELGQMPQQRASKYHAIRKPRRNNSLAVTRLLSPGWQHYCHPLARGLLGTLGMRFALR